MGKSVELKNMSGVSKKIDLDKTYKQYSEKVYRYLRSHVSSQDDVEELHSKVFLKICQSSDSYKGNPNAVSSFVYTITRNQVIDYYRTAKISDTIDEFFLHSAEIEEDYCKKERLEELAYALENLSSKERLIIVIHWWQEKSLNEVASMIGLSYDNVKRTHKASLEKIKNLMEKGKIHLVPSPAAQNNVHSMSISKTSLFNAPKVFSLV